MSSLAKNQKIKNNSMRVLEHDEAEYWFLEFEKQRPSLTLKDFHAMHEAEIGIKYAAFWSRYKIYNPEPLRQTKKRKSVATPPEPADFSSNNSLGSVTAVAAAPAGAPTAFGYAIVNPELSDMARLLMVDMQNNKEEEVVDAMKSFRDLLQETVQRATYIMENHQKAYRLGAHSIVVLLMRKWHMNEDIQECCCRCIVTLAHHLRPNVQYDIACLGGVEAIVSAMKMFPHSNEVQSQACKALMNLAATPDGPSPLEIQRVWHRFCMEYDGIGLVLKAMEAFQDRSTLRSGCKILQCLSRDLNLREIFQKESIVGPLVAVRERNVDDDKIRTAVSAFMKQVYHD